MTTMMLIYHMVSMLVSGFFIGCAHKDGLIASWPSVLQYFLLGYGWPVYLIWITYEKWKKAA